MQPTQIPSGRANRYYTRVSVEVLLQDEILRLKWFSDLQLAYLWCMRQKVNAPTEEWEAHLQFPEFADAMDRAWTDATGGSTNTLATIRAGRTLLRSPLYEFKVYYEPDDVGNEVD